MKKNAASNENKTGTHVATTPSLFAESSEDAKISEKLIATLDAIIVSDPNMCLDSNFYP